MAEGVAATVKPEVYQVVEAVRAMPGEVSITELAKRLELDKSVISRCVRQARKEGYLINLETGRGKPSRLVIGDPMPDETVILPDADLLRGCTPAQQGSQRSTL
jgi:hypothetical protein